MSLPPVLPTIVQRHADDAAFYFARRLDACCGAEHDLRSLLRMEHLLQANLEGLRVAQLESAAGDQPVGTAGWDPVLRRLNRWRTRDEAFVAGVLALQALGMGHGALWQALQQEAQAQHTQTHGDDITKGLADAVGWLWADAAFAASHPDIHQAVNVWQRSPQPLWRRAALLAHLASGQEPPTTSVEAALATPDPDLAQTAAACASRWGLSAHTGSLLALMEAEAAPPPARCAAAAALCLTVGMDEPDLRTECLRLLGQAWRQQPGSLALEPLVVWALTSLEAPSDIETALGQRNHRRAALQAMRFSADPRWLPALLQCAQHQCQPAEVRQFFAEPRSNLARLAGDVFAHLSGACIGHQLWQPVPEPQSDDDLDAEATLLDPRTPATSKQDPDGALLWPDPQALEAWWQTHGNRLAGSPRLLAGLPLDAASASQVLANAQATQPQRLHAAYAHQLLQPGPRMDVYAAVPVQCAQMQALGRPIQRW